MLYFADVILPLALDKPYTYAVEKEDYLILKPGFRVAVSLGKTKIYTGVVIKLHHDQPENYAAKYIEMILEQVPSISIKQIELWEWISKYYQCKLGEIMRAALPSNLLLESETVIEKKVILGVQPEMTDQEYIIFESLDTKALNIKEIIEILGRKSVLGLIQNMLSKGLIDIHQKLSEKYNPKKIRYIRLVSHLSSSKSIKLLFDSLKNSPKQKQLLMGLFDKNPIGTEWKKVSDLLLKTGVTTNVLRTMISKDILEENYFKEDRVLYSFDKQSTVNVLSKNQETALKKIDLYFESNDIVLFQGITGSGKTEVYMELISESIEKGNQVLYMLPEISLTPQIVKRLQTRFGESVTVYHSKFSVHERTEVWFNVSNNKSKAQVIVGTRSSIFLPFNQLGLIIIDEEHELSYKQFDPAPRYHARDTAIILSQIYNAKVLMGSATPSVESSFNLLKNKFKGVYLNERYGNIDPPEIEIIDLKLSYKKKEMKGAFSQTLINGIKTTLALGKQVILFHNQRGYAPIMECLECGHTPQCNQCDITLTYHQQSKQLKCHYCGFSIIAPNQCNECGSTQLLTKGFGTQQIQEQAERLFPEFKTARMDWDTTRGKWAFDKLINAFVSEDIKILVGTQMVVKGLDFQNVHLVGVLNADHLLNFPDFRAHERTYQMLSQVSGRAGRKKTRGRVMIQTYQPKHPIIQQVISSDYESMLLQQLKERKEYRYPPYHRLIKIVIKHKNIDTVKICSTWIFNVLNQTYKGEILGPVFPPIARLRNRYHMQILIKISRVESRNQLQKLIKSTIKSFESVSQFRSCKVTVDIDPF
tara:strand:+ start:6604 stop:9051 length:2448 start_codon:yes stop_codon:yes gene_type:complete